MQNPHKFRLMPGVGLDNINVKTNLKKVKTLLAILVVVTLAEVNGENKKYIVHVSGTVRNPGVHYVNVRGAAHALEAADGILPAGCPDRGFVYLKEESGDLRRVRVNIQEILREENPDILLPVDSVLSFSHESIPCNVIKFNTALSEYVKGYPIAHGEKMDMRLVEINSEE